MTTWTLPMEGGCRCDRVRFSITAAPMFTAVCHCTGCQHMSASAYSTTICVPIHGFSVIKGQTVIGGLHGDLQHNHCDWCKSWLFTRMPPHLPFVNVRATMLDDASWFVPFIETWTQEGLPWAKTPAKHSYPQFPPMEQLQSLLAEFAALPPAH